jgi:hypothetical protein
MDTRLQKTPLKIGIGHQSRVGKDTCADYIISKIGGNKYAFSTGVYDVAGSVQTILRKPVVKNPALLQLIGEGMRQIYGDDVWVDQMRNVLDELGTTTNIIVTDVRYKNEMDLLRSRGFILIGINRPNRIIDRDPNHPSEIGLKLSDFDIVIQNTGTIDKFHKKIDDVLGKLRKNNQPVVIRADGIVNKHQSTVISDDGTQRWYQNGKLHRDDDQPAVIYANGRCDWYQDGKLHRDGDKPAKICADGTLFWCQHGEAHRDNDQPAIIHIDGWKEWRQRGYLHRDNDQPALTYVDGRCEWYQNGKLHRDNDLPAVIYADGSQFWYQHGERHRDNDRPAVIRAYGSRKWYQCGKYHRDNDQPAVFRPDGTQIWIQYNEIHRDNDRPAIIRSDGSQCWYQHGERHRDNDQPAVICASGSQFWYQHGKFVR